MLKSCPYCGRVHPDGVICGKKPVRIRTRDESDAAAFRNTARWRRIRTLIKQRDRYLCRVCFDRGEWIPGAQYVEVHHIVPAADSEELRDEPGNLITLCRRHHEDAEAGRLDRDYLRELAKSSPFLAKRGD